MFLEALMEGSPKTYDTPPFYGDQKVSVTTKKGDGKNFKCCKVGKNSSITTKG